MRNIIHDVCATLASQYLHDHVILIIWCHSQRLK